MSTATLRKKLALLIIFVLLFGSLPISSAEGIGLEVPNVDEPAGEAASEPGEEPEPVAEEPPAEELPPVEEVAPPQEPPVDISPIEEEPPEEPGEEPLPIEEEPIAEPLPVEDDEQPIEAVEESDPSQDIDESQEDESEETEPETNEPKKDEADEEEEDDEEVSDNAPGIDGPISNPGTGQVYYTGQVGSTAPSFNWLPQSMLLADNPVIGVDHPANPGEIMLFKEAQPVEGKVNTWRITVRVEAKEAQKSNDIVLVLDTSGSMAGSKLNNTKAAAKQFIDQLLTPAHPETRIKLVTFAGDVTDHHSSLSGFVNYTGAAALKNAVDALYADGGTFTQGALRYARSALGTSSADLKQIVFLSDGMPTYGYSITDPENYLSQQYIAVATTEGAGFVLHYPDGNRKATTTGVPADSFTNARIGAGSEMFHRYYNPTGFTDDEYYNFGNSAIAEAGFAKAAGYTIHTIAMDAGTQGTAVLQGIASPGNAYATTDPTELASIFATIASKILSAMTNAAANDPMGTGFEVIGNVSNISASTGPDSYQLNGQTISWTIGTPSQPLESDPTIKYEWLSYEVEINDDILLLDPPADGMYYTNGDTTISFTDINGVPQNLPFPKPQVDPVLWIAEKVLKDAQGNIITPSLPGDAIFPLHVTGAGYDRTILMNPGDGGLRKLLTDLRAQQTYTVAEVANGFVYGDVAFDEFDKKIEIKLNDGEYVETNQFIITADAFGIPNQDVYIRVTNTMPETSVRAKKVWDDNDSDNRPEIYFQLYRQISGGQLEVVPATDATPNPVIVPASLEVAWHHLAQYDNDGNQYSFVVKEVNADGIDTVPPGYVKTEEYDEANDIWVITNRYVPVTITKTVSKIWDDDDDAAGYRPESVRIVLYADNTPVREVILNESNNWTHTWIDLPQGPVYTVREEPVPPRYSVEYEYIPMTLSDSYVRIEPGNEMEFPFAQLGYPSYYVAKKGNQFLVWTMGQLNDLQKQQFIDQFRALNVNGFNGISLDNTTFVDGLEFSYEGMNISVPLQKFWFSYKSAWSMFAFGQYHDKVEVTNRYDPASVTATKVWDDWEDEYGLRPESITLQLLQNDIPFGDPVTVTPDEDGNWRYTWKNLPKVDADGEAYVYTVVETPVPGYLPPEYNQDDLTVTNRLDVTAVTAKKVWDDLEDVYGLRPESITLQLRQNDQNLGEPVTVTPDDDGNWSYTWENLPKFDADGEAYVYTVVETPVPGYQNPRYSTDDEGNLIVINILDFTNVTVRKVWDDQENAHELRPASIILQLQRNSENFGDPVIVTPDEDGNWSYTWEDLPKVDGAGEPYVYTVVETAIPGYKAPVYSTDDDGNLIVTNTIDLTSRTVQKIWEDQNDKYGLRPTEIYLQLYRNGLMYLDPVTVTPDEDGNWSYTWHNLPVADSTGNPYVYSVVETPVAHYLPPNYGDDGFTITNRLDVTDVAVKKVWDDEEDKYELRPESITLQLMQNGAPFGDPVIVTPDEEGNWSYTWEDLPKVDAAGEPYVYTVVETAIPGYKTPVYSTDDDGNLIVTNQLETADITATKIWDDQNDKYGLRPESITLQLMQNGVPFGDPVTVTPDEEGNWSYTWPNLPKVDAAGEAYIYTVVETPVVGYEEPDYSDGGLTVTNRLITNDVTAKKLWDDQNDKYGLRPESITLQLMQNDVPFGDPVTVTPDDDGNWSYTWENLPKVDAAGEPYEYRVVETPVPHYNDPIYSDDGLTVTNSLDVTDVTARKLWDDQEDKYGLRPDSITLQLMQNGVPFGDPVTVTPDEDGNWHYTWENLPRVDADGEPYEYTVVETPVPHYSDPTYSDDGLTVTNSLDVTNVTARKIWDDQEDKYGLRPESITLQLMQNGVPFGDPVIVTPDEDGNWYYTWENLPRVDADGEAYIYTVVETPVPHYQDPTYSDDGLTVTNSLDVTNVTARKIWDDQEDKYGLRPDSITLQLMQNGVPFGDPVTVTPDEEGNWHYTWENLPKVDADGEVYIYTVVETPVPHYQDPTYSDDGLTVTNSLDVTDVTARKIWDDQEDKYGLRPESITLQLMQNGVPFGDPVTVTPDDDGNWHYTWENLPKVDDEGEAYVYTVVETPVPHYQDPTYSDDGLTVTNSLDVTDVTARKIWDDQEDKYGLRPESITLQLMQNGVPFGDPVIVTPDEDGNWHYTWENLPRVDADGEAYIYTVVETPVPHYQDPTYSDDGLTVTNSLDVTDVTARKIWDDQEDKYGLRPESITLQLMQNGVPFGDPVTVTPDEDGNWHYTWENLPRVDADGEAYIYTVVETSVPHYQDPTYSDDGLTVTNSLDVTDVTAHKIWDDQEDKYGLRPESITLQLMQNGVPFGDPVTVTPDEDGNWHYTWENLPRVDADGEAYIYTVVETPVPHYQDPTYSDDGLTVTNSLDVTDVTARKIWDDQEDKYGLRPVSITLQLMQNGVPFGDPVTVTPDEDGNWHYTWENLPNVDGDGEAYIYTVVETPVPHYQDPTYSDDGLTVTNSLDVTDISVIKLWDEEYDWRPESITLQLLQNGVPFGEPVIVTPDEDGNWYYTWKDLPRVDAEGEPYIYEIEEFNSAPFVPIIEGDAENGFTITNHKPTFTVEKSASTDRYHNPGDIITYQVIITNTGKVAIEGLIIEDTLVPFEDMTLEESLTEDGILEVGEIWTLTYTYIITEEDVANGHVLNVVSVTDPLDPENPQEDDEEIFKPSYTVDKMASEETYENIGDILNYTVVIVNTGQVAIEDLVIEDSLVPFEDMTLEESMTEDGILEVGETWTLTYQYTVTEEDLERGYVLNLVSVTDPQDPDNPKEDEEDVPLDPKPGMTVEKTAKETSFSKVGEIIHYTVIVTNTGNVSIKNLIIEDTLVPFEDMTLVESKIQDGHLQIGETWTLSYEYKVTQEDLDRGSVLNLVAAIDPDNPDKPVEDDEEVPGEKKPSMEIKKVAKEDKFTKLGDIIHYTVVVKNTGNVTLTNLQIEDTLVAFKDMTLVESMTADGHLEVGETWTLTYTYKVTQADVDKGYVLNKVIAKSPEYPDDPVEDEVKVPYEKPKKLPSTGMGSNNPLLVTGIGLLMVTAYLSLKRKRQDK